MKVEGKGQGEKRTTADAGGENQTAETSEMTHLPFRMHGANQRRRRRQLEFTCVYIGG